MNLHEKTIENVVNVTVELTDKALVWDSKTGVILALPWQSFHCLGENTQELWGQAIAKMVLLKL